LIVSAVWGYLVAILKFGTEAFEYEKIFQSEKMPFNAFAWNDNCDPIEDCYMWAILEGLRRLGTWAAQ